MLLLLLLLLLLLTFFSSGASQAETAHERERGGSIDAGLHRGAAGPL